MKKQTNKQTNDPLKAGFYDPLSDSMVMVQEWKFSIAEARLLGLHFATLYQRDPHDTPSPLFCAWNKKEYASIIPLDDQPRDSAFLKHVLTLLV